MTDTQNTPTTPAGIPANRKWILFAILAIFAGTLYGTTMYRIRSSGFLGVKQDQLAHPEKATEASGTLQDSAVKAAPSTTPPAN
ncbi:MAG: hypothetical protein COB59_06480 [Rhodospirillaceae bacterium]|nr:MAG: hypothetical protein COB59_06480 [Rhodospirillaceae bacterium]